MTAGQEKRGAGEGAAGSSQSTFQFSVGHPQRPRAGFGSLRLGHVTRDSEPLGVHLLSTYYVPSVLDRLKGRQ